jgi:hypothetical protein
MSFSALSMAMLLSGLPGLRPGNTNSPNLGNACSMATTWGDNGTRCGSVRVLRSLRRSGGITHDIASNRPSSAKRERANLISFKIEHLRPVGNDKRDKVLAGPIYLHEEH